MGTHRLPVGVIGAGIGGLSAAIRLAVAGHHVIVFEQNEAVGGKMGEVRREGFRWDTGPSVITMRHVIEALFALAGTSLDRYLELVPVDPLTRYFFADGKRLDLTSNWHALAQQLAELDERDVQGYLRFLAHAANLHRITGPAFIYDTPPSLADFRRVPLRDMVQVAPWLTMQQLIERHVHSPHLRQVLGRFATYVGASPYLAPSTLAVIAHVELTGGVWYPRGGVYALADALRRLALDVGVEIRTGVQVTHIGVEDRQVTHVQIEPSPAPGNDALRVEPKDASQRNPGAWESVPVTALVANVDVTTVYDRLLPHEVVDRRRLGKLMRRAPSCSGYALLLGVEGISDDLCHHNIFFSGDYPQEFRQIFTDQLPPTDPTVYVAITSKSDPNHAPPGHENWFVLVNVPALSPMFNWENDEESYRAVVLRTLAQHGHDLTKRIQTVTPLTPVHLAQRTGAWRGALYGISSNQALNAFRRPHNRAPEVRGLYFAGGATHPGGGVPMVTLSGKVAAQLLLEDFPA